MDLSVDTLNIASAAKTFLKSLGFEKVSDLSSINYFTLAKLSTDYHMILFTTHELQKMHLIQEPCTNTHIDTINLSSRLKNILKRNYVFYLCQLSEIPKEVIRQFRGLGSMTIRELEQLCEAYDIETKE